MNHALDHHLSKPCIGRVGQLCADSGVNLLHRLELVILVQDDENVSVREAALLELDDEETCERTSKNFPLQQIFDKFVKEALENAGDDVRPVFRLLSWKEIFLRRCQRVKESESKRGNQI